MFIQIFLMRYSSVSRANTTGAKKKAIKSRQEKFSMAIKTGPYHTHCTNENVCPLILSQLINSCIQGVSPIGTRPIGTRIALIGYYF